MLETRNSSADEIKKTLCLCETKIRSKEKQSFSEKIWVPSWKSKCRQRTQKAKGVGLPLHAFNKYWATTLWQSVFQALVTLKWIRQTNSSLQVPPNTPTLSPQGLCTWWFVCNSFPHWSPSPPLLWPFYLANFTHPLVISLPLRRCPDLIQGESGVPWRLPRCLMNPHLNLDHSLLRGHAHSSTLPTKLWVS